MSTSYLSYEASLCCSNRKANGIIILQALIDNKPCKRLW